MLEHASDTAPCRRSTVTGCQAAASDTRRATNK
jgi:hypothetical protein